MRPSHFVLAFLTAGCYGNLTFLREGFRGRYGALESREESPSLNCGLGFSDFSVLGLQGTSQLCLRMGP